MRMTIALMTLFVILFCFQSSNYAQDVSSEKTRLVEELIQAVGSKDEADKTFDMMMSMQQEMTIRSVNELFEKDASMSPEAKAEAKETVKASTLRINQRVNDFFKKEIEIDKLINETIGRFYLKNFTEDELRTMIAFYNSSAGKKTISLAPQLMQETMQTMTEKLIPKIGPFIESLTKDEYEKMRTELIEKSRTKRPVK